MIGRGRMISSADLPLMQRIRLSFRSIGMRLALSVGATIFVAVVVAGTLVVQGMAEVYRQEARNRAVALLSTLAAPCALAVSVNALDRLDGYLAEVVQIGGSYAAIEQVKMLDPVGHTLAQAERHEHKTELLDEKFSRQVALSQDVHWRQWHLADRRPMLAVSMPTISGIRWGTLVAVIDLTDVERSTDVAENVAIFAALILTIVLATVAYQLLLRIVVRPVRELGHAAQAIERGQWSTRAPEGRPDELGKLAQAFNQMASEVQSYTESLERKVADRSAEVQAKNVQLEKVNSQLQQAVDELAFLSTTDALTNVPNRRHFTRVLDEQVARPQTGALTLLMMDVDHFKRVNDRFGHPAGDAVLREVAAVLGKGLRGTDILARYGGEEFAAVLPDTPRETGIEVAERLRTLIAAHDFAPAVGQEIGQLTMSFGVACLPQDAANGDALISRSDAALYQAKNAGRNRVV